MKFLPLEIPGLVLIEPEVHRDTRGYFLETYQAAKYQAGGVAGTFVQDNQSSSQKGTLRGLHGQLRNPQGKLVRCVRGEIFDVAVDVRPDSAFFGRWDSIRISGEDFRQIYIPPGFLHGFCVLSDMAEVSYKCTAPYDPSDEFGVAWNDPDLGIRWPVDSPLISKRDEGYPCLKDLGERLESYRGLFR